jgi:hypothetical protein
MELTQMPKRLDKFILSKIKGDWYVIHTIEPFIVCRVWFFTNIEKLKKCIFVLNPMAHSESGQYNICLTMWAVLGDRIILHDYSFIEINSLVSQMLVYFTDEVIKKNNIKYEKFKK